LEVGTVSLWWLVAAFFAGGYVAVFVMALMNMASYESDRAEMSSVGMPGADAAAADD
jgi:RsiW-degrading membrane proteinase PrsW (M82 family)